MTQSISSLGNQPRLFASQLMELARSSVQIDSLRAGVLERALRAMVERFCEFLGLEPNVSGVQRPANVVYALSQGNFPGELWQWLTGMLTVLEAYEEMGISFSDLATACQMALPSLAENCRRYGLPVDEQVELSLRVTPISVAKHPLPGDG